MLIKQRIYFSDYWMAVWSSLKYFSKWLFVPNQWYLQGGLVNENVVFVWFCLIWRPVGLWNAFTLSWRCSSGGWQAGGALLHCATLRSCSGVHWHPRAPTPTPWWVHGVVPSHRTGVSFAFTIFWKCWWFKIKFIIAFGFFCCSYCLFVCFVLFMS